MRECFRFAFLCCVIDLETRARRPIKQIIASMPFLLFQNAL